MPHEWGAPHNAQAVIATMPNDVVEHLTWMYARERNKGAVRTLNDMTEEEIVELERLYGCKVKRPGAASVQAESLESAFTPTSSANAPSEGESET